MGEMGTLRSALSRALGRFRGMSARSLPARDLVLVCRERASETERDNASPLASDLDWQACAAIYPCRVRIELRRISNSMRIKESAHHQTCTNQRDAGEGATLDQGGRRHVSSHQQAHMVQSTAVALADRKAVDAPLDPASAPRLDADFDRRHRSSP